MNLLKRIALVMTKVLLGILLLLALLVGVMIWHTKNADIEYELFSELESGDRRNILMIEVGNPVLPYGPHPVIISVINASDSGVIATHKTQLANDGMTIDADNIYSIWTDTQTARVCMRGDEQSDAVILIDVADRKITERHEAC